MRTKPRVCLVDEDQQVQVGWEQALSHDALLVHYDDFEELLRAANDDPGLLPSFDCVVMGRYFRKAHLDVCEGPLVAKLRDLGVGAIFLNWQGYLTKGEIDARFDGRLFNRYGVRWQTLRSRIQKTRTQRPQYMTVLSPVSEFGSGAASSQALASENTQRIFRSKPQRCQDLLRDMARKAAGRHREKLEYYAAHDQREGIALLEAIYNRLLTATDFSATCPSQYINTSPIVAKNILKEALFGV